MAIPTPVNSQITDAVAQQNVAVLAAAPAMAMGAIYQSAAHSLGILYQNAVQAQQQSAICAQAASNQGVMQIYSMGSVAAAAKQARANRANDLLMLLVALKALR